MNRITYTFLTISLVLFSFSSCSNGTNTEDLRGIEAEEFVDTLPEVVTDSTVNMEPVEAEATLEIDENKDIQESTEHIIKAYGEQWDFCYCAQKQDSVNTALMEAEGDEFDKVMERSDYIDLKCKALLIQPNTTPEERERHQKRIRDCLKK